MIKIWMKFYLYFQKMQNIIFVNQIFRGLDAKILQQKAFDFGLKEKYIDSVSDAYQEAQKKAILTILFTLEEALLLLQKLCNFF
jgi:hypothetical protein